MLVMLPAFMRKDRGVAFMATVPKIPDGSPPLETVEIRPDGSMRQVITLDPTGIDAVHDTTAEAQEATTPRMRETAEQLGRFTLQHGMTLAVAVDKVREMHLKDPQGPPADNAELLADDSDLVDGLARAGNNNDERARAVDRIACRLLERATDIEQVPTHRSRGPLPRQRLKAIEKLANEETSLRRVTLSAQLAGAIAIQLADFAEAVDAGGATGRSTHQEGPGR